MVRVPLKCDCDKGKFMIVDNEDAELAMRYKWRLKPGLNGGVCRSGKLMGKKSSIYFNREILGLLDAGIRVRVYYKNRDILDLRKENLGVEDYTGLSFWRKEWTKRGKRSKFKGVWAEMHEDGTIMGWRARVHRQGKACVSHPFAREEDAALKYNEMLDKLGIDLAYRNKIKGE